MKVISVFQPADIDSNLPASSSSTSMLSSINVNKKNIFVCTFCQVFSPYCAEITEHIIASHSELLPSGTRPENFVSKLQALQGNNVQKIQKVGRPRKIQNKNCSVIEPKSLITEPVPGPDGLFWCKKCLRHFRKSRQLTQHICLDEDQDISSNESSIESVEDTEFKTHTAIERIPWSKRKKSEKLKLKENAFNTARNAKEEITDSAENREIGDTSQRNVIPHWRNDPSYIPLFHNDDERFAFEEHLKAIDYSFVDNLFQMKEKKCRNHKSTCGYVQSVVYSCNRCKKVLSSLSHIRLHCLIHTDLKPFTCPNCSYRTNSKGSLYMHMRKHTGNVFCCSSCDFKCIKRSHLLDHEATHSSVFHLCKLCKNTYKTLKSLIAHIRKYHNNPGGKKYVKSLTAKQPNVYKCTICNKKFKSAEILKNHDKVLHASEFVHDPVQNNQNECQLEHNSNDRNDITESLQVDNSVNPEVPSENMQCDDVHPNDPLAEIVLNNFLQQEQSQAIMYDNTVFQGPNENLLRSSSSSGLLNSFQAKAMSNELTTESSVLEDCQKTLDILNECLQNSDLQTFQSTTLSSECVQNFNRQPNISRKHSMQSNSESSTENVQHLQEISMKKCEEPKPVEIKLFEKCQRAPAYVCCVCSAIYICPSTLKVHLKEHVNNTNSNLIEQSDEQFDSAEASTDLDNVCEILQDSAEAGSYDEELEKLYTSSLDMMWYLPEVSVVLQNDPVLFDRLLDDISNFPMSVNESSQGLDMKDTDENVLKCFDEL